MTKREVCEQCEYWETLQNGAYIKLYLGEEGMAYVKDEANGRIRIAYICDSDTAWYNCKYELEREMAE